MCFTGWFIRDLKAMNSKSIVVEEEKLKNENDSLEYQIGVGWNLRSNFVDGLSHSHGYYIFLFGDAMHEGAASFH